MIDIIDITTDKIRVAIIRENGLFYGGTERFLQIMASECNKDMFVIDYYTTDLMAFADREKYLLDNGVNIIKFKCDNHRFKWFPFTLLNKDKWGDFWNKFNPDNYDVIQITNFGWSEEPTSNFNDDMNVCEFTVFPPYNEIPGVKYHILNSNYVKEQWIHSGGSNYNSCVIPVPVKKFTNENLRSALNISNDKIVCGFHQRKDDTLFSPVQLEAFKQLEDNCNTVHMVIMNASDLYKKQAALLNIKNISFIPYQENVSLFLNTLDIYTHGRKDGETYGMAIAEAMIHRLPCISHRTPYYNAMSSIIGNGGFVVSNIKEYTDVLFELVYHNDLRRIIGENAFNIAYNNYSYDTVIPKIEEVWKKVALDYI